MRTLWRLRYSLSLCWMLLACSDGTGPSSVGELATVSTGWAYSYHTCAVTTTGAAYCWGTNHTGELGSGSVSQTPSNAPLAVEGGIRFSSVGVAQTFSCGLATDGAAYCWGNNDYGHLGRGTMGGRDTVPVRVVGGLTYTSLTVGFAETCGITADGRAYCWGEVHEGPYTATPVALAGDLRFASISSSAGQTCGITTGASTYCWRPTDSLPVLVAGAPALVSISAGAYYACGLTADGSAYCWGQNDAGQLGIGRFSPSEPSALPVVGQLHFSSIDAGAAHTCAVSVEGDGYCWGRNLSWAVGDSANGYWSIPRRVWGSLKFRSISAGDEYTCAVSVADTGYCWGDNSFGQFGSAGPPGYRPQRITGF